MYNMGPDVLENTEFHFSFNEPPFGRSLISGAMVMSGIPGK